MEKIKSKSIYTLIRILQKLEINNTNERRNLKKKKVFFLIF